MKKYHITWLESRDDFYSKGEVFIDVDEVEALLQFRKKYPNAVFLSCVSEDLIQIRVG